MAFDPYGGAPKPLPPVNLDYAASTPLRPEALDAMADYDQADYAGVNPNSLHTLGRAAAARLEECRRAVAKSFGAKVRPSEVIFTGGGSESNHLALFGLAEAKRERDHARTRIIVSAIEHDSILDNEPLLRARGFSVEKVRPCAAGYVEPSSLEALMGPDVALVSIMLANNETGVVQPLKELAAVAHAHGAVFHTDAVQGWLHIPFEVGKLGVDALSIAGHKVGAPVGIGALYLKNLVELRAQSLGGGQERGYRPGTQDLRAIVGLAAVAAELHPTVADDRAKLQQLSDGIYTALTGYSNIHATMGDFAAADRLPGIVSLYVDSMESEQIILKLDGAGFEVSAASACSSGSLDPSHVLTAMGVPRDKALGSVRISFDDRVDPADLVRFCQAFVNFIARP